MLDPKETKTRHLLQEKTTVHPAPTDSIAISTSHPMIGITPIEALLHIRAPTLFGTFIAADASTPLSTYINELVKNNLITWLLRKYNLPSSHSMCAPPPPSVKLKKKYPRLCTNFGPPKRERKCMQ